MDKIVDGLFISDYITSANRDELKKNNITHVVIAAKFLKPPFPMVHITHSNIISLVGN